MKNNISSASGSLRSKLLISSKEFTFRKMHVAFLFFMLAPIIFTHAQTGENDPTFNNYDQIPAHGANGQVNNLLVQPDDKIIISGNFSRYNGMTANNLARLNNNGKLDPTFHVGSGVIVDGGINTMALLPGNKLIVAGKRIVRLNSNGTPDYTFHSGYYGENISIKRTIIQPDGKILAAGNYYTIDPAAVNWMVRLNSDGLADPTFHATITDSLVGIAQIALQPDGKIIVLGYPSYDALHPMMSYLYVIRLNADGSRDYSFNALTIEVGGDSVYPRNTSIAVENTGNILIAYGYINSNSSAFSVVGGNLLRLDPNGNTLSELSEIYINAMKLQADGKIVLAGAENLGYAPYAKKQVIRLNTDLSVDSSFSFVDNKSYGGISSQIQTIDFQSNGKIIVGGLFSDFNGLIENNVASINNDGSFDHSFNRRSGCNGGIFASAVQTNGKTIIGGEFSSYNFNPVSNIARLNTNGELDNTFYTGSGTNGKIYTIALTGDNKIIIGGDFTSYDGHACHNLVRLDSNGSIDLSFIAQADDIVRKITIADDGKIIIGGNFDNVNGVSRIAVARLQPNGALDLTFNSPITDILPAEAYDCKISPLGKIYAAVNYRYPFPDDMLPNFVDSKILRLNNDGSIDPAFTIPSNTFYEINTIAFNNDGKVLAGGQGWYPAPSWRISGIIAQFNSDGSVDTTFEYVDLQNYLDKPVRTIDVLENDKIIIGGDFENHILMLNENGNVNTDLFQYADDNIYTTTLIDTNQMIICGIFSEYSYDVRNSIAKINLTENNSLAIIDINKDETLTLFPNPASSEININNLKPRSALRVYNSIGKEVFAETITDTGTTIKLSNYSNGIYFIITENNGVRTSSTKFIVSK